MINELVAAGCSPSLRSIFSHEWDKQFKPLAKQLTYGIKIKTDGGSAVRVYEIRELERDHVLVLRKYEESNGFSFPGFNLPSLINLTKDNFVAEYLTKNYPELREEISKLNAKQYSRVLDELLKKHFDPLSFNEWLIAAGNKAAEDKEYRKAVFYKLDKCLKTTASNLWNKISRVPSIKTAHNYRLLNEQIQREDIAAFFDGLRDYIISQIKCYDDWTAYSPLLFQAKATAGTLPAVQVFLDYYDPDAEDYPVAHKKTIERINEALLADNSQSSETSVAAGSMDAYGCPAAGSGDKFPSANVPILGSVILRSMVKEVQCQFRYGTADAESFPVGDTTRRLAKLALETLSQPQFKGDTWGTMGDKEVLFAYPTVICDEEDAERNVLPIEEIKLASVLTAEEKEDQAAAVADFTEIASSVIDALKGIGRPLYEIEINVFILKKLDKAHTKVIYYTGFSAEHLQRAANAWTEGCANLPESILNYREWGESKGEQVSKRIRPVYPKDIFRSLNKVWRLDGEGSSQSSRIKASEGIDLLLRVDDTAYFSSLLSFFITNAAPYFAKLGSFLVLNRIPKEKSKDDRIKNPAILGLLLYKLGRNKEDYMKDQFYQLGKLLALADGLQYHYCKWVRSSDDDRKRGAVNAPVQLVGNSMLRAAEMSPQTVIANLGRRTSCYMTWAKTDRDMEKGISRWFIKQINEVSCGLEITQWPSRLSPLEKSELYLGYMAGFGSDKS